jgi:hypothetical protein
MIRRWIGVAFVVAARAAIADPSPDPAQLYRDGQIAYDQARYDDALTAWQESYKLSHASGLLYNIGQAYRLRNRPGDCALARDQYRRFATLATPSPQRELADRYVRDLAVCATTPRTPTEAPEANNETIRTREIEIGAVGVAGLGLLVTGIAIGHHASTLGDEVTAACSVSCNWSTEKSKDAAGRRDSTLGWTFGTIGLLAIVGDAALYYVGVHKHSVAVSVGTSSAAVSWSRSW